jgi:hypothetical protein
MLTALAAKLSGVLCFRPEARCYCGRPAFLCCYRRLTGGVRLDCKSLTLPLLK